MDDIRVTRTSALDGTIALANLDKEETYITVDLKRVNMYSIDVSGMEWIYRNGFTDIIMKAVSNGMQRTVTEVMNYENSAAGQTVSYLELQQPGTAARQNKSQLNTDLRNLNKEI